MRIRQFCRKILGNIHWVQLFLFLIIPLVLCGICFNPNERIYLVKTVDGNTLRFNVPDFEPGPEETMREVFNAPFNLKWYEVYFEHNRSSQSNLPSFFRIHLDNGKNLTLCLNSSNYVRANLEKGFSGKVSYVNTFGNVSCLDFEEKEKSLDVDVPPNHFAFTGHVSEISPNTTFSADWGAMIGESSNYPFSIDLITVYAKPEFWSLATKWILLFIAWDGTLLIIFEAKNKIYSSKADKENDDEKHHLNKP